MAIRKRESSTGSASGAKRQRTVAKRCQAVKEVLLTAEGFPASVLKMLSHNLPECLGVVKEERHAYQTKVIGMVGEVLKNVEEKLQQSIQEAEAKTTAMSGDKETRAKALEDATAAVTAKNGAVEASKTALTESKAAAKAAIEALTEAATAQEAGDKELNEAETKKTELEAVLNDNFVPLKEGSVAGPVAEKCLEKLSDTCKELTLDASMVSALPSALTRSPGERGSFDGMVLQQLEDELKKKIGALADTLSSGETGKAERAANVAAKQAALDAAREHEDSSKTNKAQCQQDLVDAKEAQKAAKAAVASFAPEMQQAEKDLATAKASLESFTEGASSDYKELLEYSSVAPAAPPAETGEQ